MLSSLNIYWQENFRKNALKSYFSNNKEQLEKYYMTKEFWKGRGEGVSAMLRVKNEEKWIKYCLLSIKDVFDEIVITIQNSTDNTVEIIKELDLPNVKVAYFPFDSFPYGIGNDLHAPDSINNRAYFYNWSLALTSKKWVCKWDGDMIATEEFKKKLIQYTSQNKYDIVHFKGLDLHGEDLKFLCKDAYNANEPRIFKVTPRTFYFPGPIYEEFSYPIWKTPFTKSKIGNMEGVQFLHMKYASPLSEIGKGWPDNWREIQYFQDFVSHKCRGEKFEGSYPAVLDEYFENLNS